MRLEDVLNCKGHHGFGAGYVYGKDNVPGVQQRDGKSSYCANGCAIAQDCFMAFRRKTAIRFPQAVFAYEKLVALFGDQQAAKTWKKRNPSTVADPFTVAMLANLESGFEFAVTGHPKEMGRHTIPMKDGKITA